MNGSSLSKASLAAFVASVAGFGVSAAHACVVNAIALAKRKLDPNFHKGEALTYDLPMLAFALNFIPSSL
ncbi:hypothetical protein PPUN15366_19690 [Pseudomonas putida]|nr:hypothetical protein PPUN15366_19690 [Pseudomonas putida]